MEKDKIEFEYDMDEKKLTGFENQDTGFGSVFSYLNYSSEMSDMYVAVLRESHIDRETWYADIAKKIGASAREVEIMKYCLAKDGLLEYGCSPRGGWISECGQKFLDEIDRLKNNN